MTSPGDTWRSPNGRTETVRSGTTIGLGSVSSLPTSSSPSPVQPSATIGSASLEANLRQLAMLQALVSRQRAQVVQQHQHSTRQQYQNLRSDQSVAFDNSFSTPPTVDPDRNSTDPPQASSSSVSDLPPWSRFLEGLNAPLPPTLTPPLVSTPNSSSALELPWYSVARSRRNDSPVSTGTEGDPALAGASERGSSATQSLARQQQVELDWWAHTVFTNANGSASEGPASPLPDSFNVIASADAEVTLPSPASEITTDGRYGDLFIPSPPPPTPFDWTSLYTAEDETTALDSAAGHDEHTQSLSARDEGKDSSTRPDQVQQSHSSATSQVEVDHTRIRANTEGDVDELEGQEGSPTVSGPHPRSSQRSPTRLQGSRRRTISSAVACKEPGSSGSDTATPPPLSVLGGATIEEVEEDRRKRNTAASGE